MKHRHLPCRGLQLSCHPGVLLQLVEHKPVESQSSKHQKNYDLKVLALLFWLQKQPGVTRSDGNVSAWLKLILPRESPEQLFTSDKMHCVSTPANVLHLRDLCVHLDARVHVRSEGTTNVHRYHRYWYPTRKCISLLYLLEKQKCWQVPSAARFPSSCPTTMLVVG